MRIDEMYNLELEKFCSRLEMQRYASSTIQSYRSNICIFLAYFKRNPASISADDIEIFINDKVQNQNIGISHQKALVGAIRKFYELVYQLDLKLNYLYPKRRALTLPRFFSKYEVRKILEAATNLKHKAILTTIYSCGLRLNELINLELSDIRSEEQVILVRQGKGNKDRTVQLPIQLLKLLRAYFLEYKPKMYLFEGQYGGKYAPRSVQLLLKNVMQKAQIHTQGSVHTLRHSYATHLLIAGVDIRSIQELLGHNNLSTTQVYTHITDQQKKSIISPLDLL